MVMQRIMEPFTWGSGGRKMTPDQVARERELATALAGSIGDTSPVGHWTAGMARMVDALGSRMREGRADRAEQEGIEGASDWARNRLASVLAGGGGTLGQGYAPPGGGAIASQPITENPAGLDPSIISAVDRVDPQGGGMDAYRSAIASIESAGSGDYAAVGPTHPSLGRALGRYQVMEANIGPWSREALGREVTPEEFMASPEIQDAIFDHRFGQYVNQFGPEGAAQAWFAGPGGVGRMDRRDSLGTSVSDYTSRFNSALGGGGIAEALAAPSAPSGGNSGLVEALMEGMGNPWVRQQYGGMLDALMGQQMQGMDPMRQAQLEQIMLQNEALRNPQPDYPTSFREWQLGQQHPEYGATLGGDSAAVDRINRLTENLMATGDFLDPQEARNMASGIVDGRFKLDRHPVSGVAQIVDMATQRVLYGPGAGADQQGDMGQVDPLGTMPAGTDFSEATGAAGLAANLANTASEILGLGLIAPENERATQALTNLQNRTMIDLADAVPGRPSNYLLQQFERLTLSPNNPFQGEGRARKLLTQTRNMIDQAIQENNDIIRNADLYPPQMIGQARQSMQRLINLRGEYDTVIEAFGNGSRQDGGQGTTSGGVQWRILD